jgi:hypothetical protein
MKHLTAADRAALDAVPIEVDSAGPLASCATTEQGEWRTAWMRDGGRKIEAFGPAYADAVTAARASRYLNQRIFGPTSW